MSKGICGRGRVRARRRAVPSCARVEVDGLGYHVVEGGEGPALILLAGFPQSWYAWRRVMPLLAPHFRVYAVDLPGQGDSDNRWTAMTRAPPASGCAPCPHAGTDALCARRPRYRRLDRLSVCRAPCRQVERVVLLDANIPGVTLKPAIELGPDNWKSWHFLFNSVPDLPEALLQGRERI